MTTVVAPRISLNSKFQTPVLACFNTAARSILLSWKSSKYPAGTTYIVIKAELIPLKFEEVYRGVAMEKVIDGLKPETQYQFTLKIAQKGTTLNSNGEPVDPVLIPIDELDVLTESESSLQKAIWQLIMAVIEKDAARVSAIFREYRNQIGVETTDRQGRSLLMLAAQSGDVDIVKILLDRGANPAFSSGSGKTPLSLAVGEGHFPVVQLILQKDPACVSQKDLVGTTLLMNAVENIQNSLVRGYGLSIVNLLLSTGILPTQEDNNGMTALDRVNISSGHVPSAKLLIGLGCAVKTTGTTSLMTAAMNGHTPLCQFYIEECGLNPAQKSPHGATAEQFATTAGHSKTANLINDYVKKFSKK